MRAFITMTGLAFYRGECLFIPKEGTRRLGPLKAATLDPATSLEPKNRLQVFADTCAAAVADKRRIDEAVALFDYTATLRYDHSAKGSDYAGQGAVKRGLGRLLHSPEVESWRWADVVTDDQSARCRLTAIHSDGKGCAHLDVAATFVEEGAIGDLHVVPLDDESRVFLDTVIMGAELGLDGGPKWETFDGRVRQQIWQHTGCFEPGNAFVKDKLELTTGRIICIVDARVWELYEDKLRKWCASVDLELEPIVAPGNEDAKTMENMLFLLDELKRVDPLRRAEPALAIGGGVLTDTAGFACALWRRGVPWARLPTTLLGMVDASVGIKVAVNYHRKNGVGHFYSPTHTFVDAGFLPTLEKADVISACGEIMKAALVHDASLFDLMEKDGLRLVNKNFMDDPVADEIIRRSVDTMLECIGPDLWEESLLRPMDFGHSFSRTLETDERFKLRHGEAVAIDCVMNSMIANVQGHLSDSDAQRILDVYANIGLPCSIEGITADTYKRAAREITVHRDGILRAPLPGGIGACVYTDSMPDGDIEKAFAKLEAFIAEHPATKWNLGWSFASA
jgi:3-dehydroquinate synthase